MKELEKYIDHIKNLNINNWRSDEDSASKIEELLRLYNDYKKLYFKMSTYACLIMNADFQNIVAANIFDEVENKNSELTEVFVSFSRWLKNIANLDKILGETEYLLEHKFYLKELLLKSKYLLSEKEEAIISWKVFI